MLVGRVGFPVAAHPACDAPRGCGRPTDAAPRPAPGRRRGRGALRDGSGLRPARRVDRRDPRVPRRASGACALAGHRPARLRGGEPGRSPDRRRAPADPTPPRSRLHSRGQCHGRRPAYEPRARGHAGGCARRHREARPREPTARGRSLHGRARSARAPCRVLAPAPDRLRGGHGREQQCRGNDDHARRTRRRARGRRGARPTRRDRRRLSHPRGHGAERRGPSRGRHHEPSAPARLRERHGCRDGRPHARPYEQLPRRRLPRRGLPRGDGLACALLRCRRHRRSGQRRPRFPGRAGPARRRAPHPQQHRGRRRSRHGLRRQADRRTADGPHPRHPRERCPCARPPALPCRPLRQDEPHRRSKPRCASS